ncbi:MAG: hypothetical protein NC299_10625 [Lachnospiraceae bacterium]|nr:hypothetical protein [Ruminococcus sp.]MCM1275802.1 hypothetical protein [Lachnospiraceae bacterium]
MNKRILASFLTAVMCVALVGCDNRSPLEKEFDNAMNELDKEFNTPVSTPTSTLTESVKPEPKPLDPFEDVEITFEGIAPQVRASIKGGNANVSYELDKKSELSNGSKVTVTAKLRVGKEEDYSLTSDSKEFTVENRPYYIMKLSDLTDADMEKLKTKMEEAVRIDLDSHRGGGENSTINKFDFLGNINITSSDRNESLYFVYDANITFANAGETVNYIFAGQYDNIYKEADGTIVYDGGIPRAGYDMSLAIDGVYVSGSYASLDSLNSKISNSRYERESTVKS